MELRHLLAYQKQLPDQRVWATTAEAGFPLEEENEEIHNERDEWEGKQTARFLHPDISDMAHLLNGIENQGQNLTKTQRSVIQLDSDWMDPANDPHAVKMAPKMGKKAPSPQSERPTPNPRLPRTETEARINFPPKSPAPQHYGTRHHPHRGRIKNMDRQP